jgi:shikimate kinase
MPETLPTVVLVGPPAAGKTRLGKRVAKILGVPFVDSDSVLVAEHGPISDIFAEHGEDYFRQLERAVVTRVLREPGVVALGGGAIIRSDTRADLQAHRVALITTTAEAVEERLKTGKRPLLSAGVGAWRDLVATRQAWYEEVADATFDTSGSSMDQVAGDIAAWITQEGQR